MNRWVTAFVAVLLLAGAVPAAASLDGASPTTTNETAPGASFAGVVAVQGAEVHGEVEGRTLDHRLERASSDNETAAVVAEEADSIDARLSELEARKERLTEAYENGSISKGRYEAGLATIAAQVRSLERRANRTSEVAADLPAPALEAHGVNASEVRSLAHRANEVGGGKVAAAARGVAGEGVGDGLGSPPAVGRNRTNESENGRSGGGRASPGGGEDHPDNGKGAPDESGTDVPVATDGTGNGNADTNVTAGDDHPGSNRTDHRGGNGGDGADGSGNGAGSGNGSDRSGSHGNADGNTTASTTTRSGMRNLAVGVTAT